MHGADPDIATPLAVTEGPVRWTHLPHPPGMPAQTMARDWLVREMEMPGTIPDFVRDLHGRPRLDGALPGYDVSWSHSGQRLLLALGDGVDVGADIERLRPRSRALELAERFFAPGETAWLQAQTEGDRDLAFVRLWCAKEAILKAHGRGIAFGLHRFEVGEVDGTLRLLAADGALGRVEDWTLRTFAPLPGYQAALAWRQRR